jgi:hypothetical protein
MTISDTIADNAALIRRCYDAFARGDAYRNACARPRYR